MGHKTSNKMGNFLTDCCQPSGSKGKDNLSVSISSGDCSDPIKDIKETEPSEPKPVSLLATVAQLDSSSSSSEEEQEPVDKDDVIKESDEDDGDTTSEENDSTEEQKNRDESSVMVGNGSFSPGDHEASDKDSEEVNEPVTQIEMETRDISEDNAVL